MKAKWTPAWSAAALGGVVFLLSCDPLDRSTITLAFDAPADNVTVSVRSTLPEEADAWGVRFAQANPDTDTVTWERRHGKVEAVERTATVGVDQLQKFFFDAPVTITTTRGEGWMELNVYGGGSMRATADQRREAEKLLDAYSTRAANYFEALRSLYIYLDEKPYRARDLFTDILRDDSDPRPVLSEKEEAMCDRVRSAIESILDVNDVAPNAARIFDLTYNPFPAQVRVIVKGQPLAVEGFTKGDNDTYEIKLLDAPQAVAALEGRWVSPDPIAVVYNNIEKKNSSELAAILTVSPRKTEAVVTPSEIGAALVEKMKPAPRYRLRFTTKKAS